MYIHCSISLLGMHISMNYDVRTHAGDGDSIHKQWIIFSTITNHVMRDGFVLVMVYIIDH